MGIIEQLFTADFKAPDIDLSGKTVLVTGSNVGLGFETAVQLLQRGFSKLVMSARSMEKGQAAKGRMLQRVRNVAADQIEVWQLDLASFASTREFADQCADTKLDIAVLNAAVAPLEYRNIADGFEEG